MAIELLIEMLDIARILADQHRKEILDRTGYGPGLPLQRGFSPAKQTALVGNNLYKYPIPHLCVDDDGLNIGNFHRAFPGKWGLTIERGPGFNLNFSRPSP